MLKLIQMVDCSSIKVEVRQPQSQSYAQTSQNRAAKSAHKQSSVVPIQVVALEQKAHFVKI